MTPNFKHIVSQLTKEPASFTKIALDVFEYQYKHNQVYKAYCDLLEKTPNTVNHIEDIPFIPIEFFKNHVIYCGNVPNDATRFTSSGTSGQINAKHFVHDIEVYISSYKLAFEQFVGKAKDLCIFALLPAYLERTGSSLILMAEGLIKESKYPQSGFYLNNYKELQARLVENQKQNIPTLLIGVSFALLDMAEDFAIDFPELILMETGGMKGRRKELIRAELHAILKDGFGVENVWSEYGMTELLSQAYAPKDGTYQTPPWMKILLRDVYDPFSYVGQGKTGVLNIIDLANLESCAFIQTQDLGKQTKVGFEVLGRTDTSDTRGCNLMVF